MSAIKIMQTIITSLTGLRTKISESINGIYEITDTVEGWENPVSEDYDRNTFYKLKIAISSLVSFIKADKKKDELRNQRFNNTLMEYNREFERLNEGGE